MSGFELLKRGIFVEKKNNITIHSLAVISTMQAHTHQLLFAHTQNCKTVQGDFRQNEIIENWQNMFQPYATSTNPKKWLLITLTATTSKRTYIRSLVHDLGEKIGIPLTTWSITRTNNGPYSRQDCVELLQYPDAT
jgi:tRNA U55 pseudouridine synthase TruB